MRTIIKIRYRLLILSLVFISCVITIYTTKQENHAIKSSYLEKNPNDVFKNEILNGKPVVGMNIEQLKACLSRNDIDLTFQKDAKGIYIYDWYNEEHEWVFPNKNENDQIAYITKYYFVNSIITEIESTTRSYENEMQEEIKTLPPINDGPKKSGNNKFPRY